jgi:hypothetical protein
LEDADKMESGAFYSQFGIYRDEACKNGAWSMTLPNPNVTPEKAAKLWEESEKLVGFLEKEMGVEFVINVCCHERVFNVANISWLL